MKIDNSGNKRESLMWLVCSSALLITLAAQPLAAMLTPGQYKEQALAAALRGADRTWRSLEGPPDPNSPPQ